MGDEVNSIVDIVQIIAADQAERVIEKNIEKLEIRDKIFTGKILPDST